MKSKKRDGSERAFNHGYKAAISGKPIHNNPHEKEDLKLQWTFGWREGRHDHWDGHTGISGLHKGIMT